MCTLPLSVLYAAPYNLLQGDQIHAKVIVSNAYGDSAFSPDGSGGIVVLVPDAPLTLANDAATTSNTVIRFTWTEGANNGGTQVLTYNVYYDQATGTWIQLASGLTTTYY
jgi:hypothetical protein